MKKQEYIRPEIEMIEIGTPVMLAESNIKMATEEDYNAIEEEEVMGDCPKALSRRSTISEGGCKR